MYSIQLSAVVTKPSLKLSSSVLDFGIVKCGECKIITIRISNPFYVKYVAIYLCRVPTHI